MKIYIMMVIFMCFFKIVDDVILKYNSARPLASLKISHTDELFVREVGVKYHKGLLCVK